MGSEDCPTGSTARGQPCSDPNDCRAGLGCLDVYYAADGCFEDKAQTLRNPLYRRWGRYKHFADYERAVFAPASKTEILMISEVQQPLFVKHYATPAARFHLLPPGIAQDRRAPANAAEVRAGFRREFQLAEDDLLLVQIGSGFKTKGLDRSLKAVAALPRELKQRTRLIVIGQDDPKPFLLQVKALGLSEQVQILKGRSDIPRFLLGADLLIHPAYNENTGTVLLEALVSGLPVLVTDVCGYAHYIADADCGRVLPSPFEQQRLNRLLAEMMAHSDAMRFEAAAGVRDRIQSLERLTESQKIVSLKNVDQDLLRAAIAGERFADYFYANSQDEAISAYLTSLSAERALA